MITNIHVKRIVTIGLMIVLILVTILAGFVEISKQADAAIENLSFKSYCAFTEGIDGTVGTIKDCNGVVLWSEEYSGGAELYNLIGDLKVVHIENSVANRNKEYISNADSYNLMEGAGSLKDTALSLNTTLDYELHKAVYNYMKERGVTNGSALFVDVNTGAVRAAVSLPTADPQIPVEEWENGSLINKNFTVTIPGSTMKVVTGLLLTEMDISVLDRYIHCDGEYIIPEVQESVTCITQQGAHNLTSALGVSCNCYYADCIVNILNRNAEEVKMRLQELGIANEDYSKLMEGGRIWYKGSVAAYDGSNSVESVWSLIGEGMVRISPLDLCKITSGIVNGGVTKEPYILESVTNHEEVVVECYAGKDSKITDSDIAERFYSVWKSAYDTYYGAAYSSEITVAKTGTAEYDNEKGVSKNLVGYLEKQGLVFFIEIADYEESNVMPVEVVNYVCDIT